ncbi:MAG: hypothetical protein M1823_001185 [Watsoniomyces obsoletus]|nr:MAG: hypothetical protein M1823_001185 [Watsoniomyces obsoletus]
MFSSALKSFSSNISSNYTLSSTPSTYSGPWKVYDAKKKSTGRAVSVFTFDKKTLEPHAGLARSGPSLKRAHEEVLERLKKEATSLARLRHPSILELVEPVEETRNGGLMFATEAITASLAGLLAEQDAQEKTGGTAGRSSRHAVEDQDDGSRSQRGAELDDLEVQKGLLQVAKALEFLHESAGLVHGNLTPDAIYVNAKSDWKVSGLGFSSPPDNSTAATSVAPIALSEVLNHDPRLPRFVQLSLDYSSPDFVLDSNVTTSADLFSFGLLIVALFTSSHVSPLQTNGSISAYKRLFNSASTTPSPSNKFLSSKPLPPELMSSVLPQLLARRPAQRLTAREFQQSAYFDNILVSTIRFLESLPAKYPNEKSQFMRGLSRVLNQFPKSVMEKKLLPALLEEMKDRELLALILQNVFQIIKILPSGRRAFTDKMIPRLREVFLAGGGPSHVKGVAPERDLGKEAGLMTILQNISIITENCSGKEFKDDILPIIILAIESPTHPLVDASLRCLPTILPILDYSTTKTELFPVISNVFSKTSSLGIKIRGLEAFVILCGGSSEGYEKSSDGLDGIKVGDRTQSHKSTGNTALDKYTVQEKVVPLIKGIKTKEPAVMMAALNVFRQVGRLADSEFLAMEVLPILWSMSLGPLLNLEQFRSFMDLIKSLSTRIEQEQIRKLQELSSSSNSTHGRGDDFLSFGAIDGHNGGNSATNGNDDDFARLVSGAGKGTRVANGAQNTELPTGSLILGPGSSAPVFSWSTQASQATTTLPIGRPPTSRTITPDLRSNAFASPNSTGVPNGSASYSQPWQAQTAAGATSQLSSLNWANTTSNSIANPWSAPSAPPTNPAPTSLGNLQSFGVLHPPIQPSSTTNNLYSSFSIPPPPSFSSGINPTTTAFKTQPTPPQQQQQQKQKQGLDKFESLL